ncbi:UDP-N-acetylglucosamine 4,6-dehydratase [Emcibacter sp.]|uniref:UDP-N-acetylglucosamine 4,6-dehydratase n=1 Tax=Emcibacter sp. TaxID=1979954 RepID=UPI003A909AA5
MNEILQLVGREKPLFREDLKETSDALKSAIEGKRVLVIGGAGSIGQNVAKEVFKRNPAVLHVVDISENNLVELVRDIRSSLGYIQGDTAFLPIDMGSREYESFWNKNAPYDYIFNLAAMKHVRSEKDEFSLMRMIKTNILYTQKTLDLAIKAGAKKYFAVSTDKAESPANLMGATKRIMELCLSQHGSQTAVSTARFANVAFSDGSLLHGFGERLNKRQPLSAPKDVKRYFMTGPEAGLLCLFSAVLGNDDEIYFPNLNPEENLITFSQIAERYLEQKGYEPVRVDSEDEARARTEELIPQGKWPCYFFESDTSGEKPFEEFYSAKDNVDWDRHHDLGVIRGISPESGKDVAQFISAIENLAASGDWSKSQLVSLIKDYCPTLAHVETGKYLDGKM